VGEAEVNDLLVDVLEFAGPGAADERIDMNRVEEAQRWQSREP
jgi:hypothetical protein